MDGWILGAMWSSCPLLDLVNRAACQNDHTGCPSICLCLSTQSLHPVLREPITPLHTQTCTHTLWHTYTQKKDGLQHRKESCPFFQSSSAPCCSNFLSTFPQTLPVFCSASLTKTCFIQSPAFTYGKRAAEGGTESTLAQPAAPSLPLGFSTSEHRPLLCFDVWLKSLRSGGDKGVIYLHVPGFGCLWHIFPTLLFPFFFVPEWKMESRCEREYRCTSKQEAWPLQNKSQQKKDRGCTWEEVIVRIVVCRTKRFFVVFSSFFELFGFGQCLLIGWWRDEGKVFLRDAAV